ncbi:MAG TPA: PAS domain-containing sensor histidine kinase [Myxococcales bacterium]|nr:PAS domain-containing sensor histidine kinase [Myxococcales bacterium]
MSVKADRGAEGESLYRRLVWLTLLRIAVVTVLLAAAAAAVLRSDAEDLGRVEQVLYGLILATYAASLGYLFVLRKTKRIKDRFAFVQITGDVLIAACLVYLTGGAESIVAFMFPLTVVSAAVVLYRRGAIVAAVLSSILLAVVTVGLNAKLLPPPSPSLVPASMPLGRLAFVLLAHISAIFLAAALASYLAEQVRSARERLTLREHDYLALEILHESIVRSVASGIVTSDRFGRITYVNPAAERLGGLSSRAAVGEPVEKHFPVLAGRLQSDVPVERFEAEHATPSGEQRRLAMTLAPLVDRETRNHGWVVSFEDLTSIRAMEEAIRRSERLAAVGGMAAGLAHELRNPLASMTGSIQLLAENSVFEDDDRRLMSIVLREADRLDGLVTDFLRFARPAPLQACDIDVAEIVGSALQLFRNDPTKRHVALEERIDRPLSMHGDAGQLGQVLWNLLANASEALSEDGRITVEATRKEKGAIVLSVEDSGEGISSEDLPRVFDPFFTTKERGSGLGLATVHSIIQAHCGSIAVESRRGVGTKFIISFPGSVGTQPAA